jgi:hypothetical protein
MHHNGGEVDLAVAQPMEPTVEEVALVQPIDLALISTPIGKRGVDPGRSLTEAPADVPATLDETR